jgi:hypothetical protein
MLGSTDQLEASLARGGLGGTGGGSKGPSAVESLEVEAPVVLRLLGGLIGVGLARLLPLELAISPVVQAPQLIELRFWNVKNTSYDLIACGRVGTTGVLMCFSNLGGWVTHIYAPTQVKLMW